MTRVEHLGTDRQSDMSIEEAAVELGVSPLALIRLLENGQLASHLGPDGRKRRIPRSVVASHRTERFDLRQRMVQEQRARRWAEPDDELTA